MNEPVYFLRGALLLGLVAMVGCGSAPKPKPEVPAPPPSKAAEAPAPDPEPWRNERPKPGPKAALVYPVPEVDRLTNGLTLYVLHRPAGLVELEFVVRHGASSVPAGKSGLAGLTARMLTEGTRAKSSLALAEAVESLGSTLDAGAGRDHSSVSLSVLGSDLERGLYLLGEVVKTPAFAPKEFDRVRAEWLDGLVADRQEPRQLASLAGLRLLMGRDLGAPVSGSIPDVKRLTVAELTEFHQNYYVPASAALILVGDVQLATAKPLVERVFGTWRTTAKPAVKKVEPPPDPGQQPVVIVDRPEAVQTALFIAQRFPERNAAGHEAREVLTNLLGGLFTSRINQNLRETHAYTYGARSGLVATRQWGAFAVTTSVKTDVTAPSIVEVRNELTAVADAERGKPVTREELERSKTDLVNALGAHLEHTSRVADDLSTSFVHGLPTDYASRYAPLVESLEAPAIVREAARFTPKSMVIVAVGDRKVIEPLLKKQGFGVKLAPADLTE